MSKASAHAYCNLMQFLEAHEPNFAKLAELTCHTDKLSAGFSKYGLTLLIPDDASVKKMIEMAESGDRKKLRDACAHVAALILRGGFKSAKDFQAAKSAIGNSQYPSQQVKITKFDPVTFESGATATPHAGFVDGSEGGNFAVWSLKGELPPSTGKDLPKLARAKGGKAGGYSDAHADQLSRMLRNQIALVLEQTLVGGDDKQMRGAAQSLLKWVLDHSTDDGKKQEAVNRCCLHAVDFYFLAEPHLEGNYLLDDAMIREWFAAVQVGKAPREGVCELMKPFIKTTEDDLKKIQSQRDETLKRIAADPSSAADALNAAYRSLGKDEHAQVCDEMRFLAICQFEANKAHPDRMTLNHTLNQIAEMQAMCHVDPKRVRLFDDASLDVLGAEKIACVQAFVKSSCFLFVPMREDQALKRQSQDIVPPNKNATWNVSWKPYEEHKALGEEVERRLLAQASSMSASQRKAIIDALSK
jgi:hypothetical protein